MSSRNAWIFIFLTLMMVFWLLAGLLNEFQHITVSVACSAIGVVFAACALIARFSEESK